MKLAVSQKSFVYTIGTKRYTRRWRLRLEPERRDADQPMRTYCTVFPKTLSGQPELISQRPGRTATEVSVS